MSSPTLLPPGTRESGSEASREAGAGSRGWMRVAIVTFGVVVLPAVLWLAVFLHTRSQARVTLQTSAAHIGTAQSIRLKGMTAAVEARAIQAPLISGAQVGMLTITKLVPSGTRVKKGDLLVEFDSQAQLRDFIDKQAQADDLNQQVLEAQAKEDAARAKDRADILQAQNNLGKAELEMGKIELLSRIDAEKAQEDLDEAKATLTQLKQTYDLKRKAAQASIHILDIQRDRTLQTMEHAKANSALMEIHAPIDGIVVFNTIWKQGNMGEVQEGDQVRPGVPFMQVVDPVTMEVRVPVNQEDLLDLRIGEKAMVHLDAYNDLALPGRLESIDPMGTSGDFSPKLRKFSATFSIDGHDPRLMPDLSAAVDVKEADSGSASR